MSKLRISVSVDRKAAALRGIILGETTQIEIGPEDVSPENWAWLISQLNYDLTAFILNTFAVSGPELSDLVAQIEAHRAQKAAQKAEAEARKQQERAHFLAKVQEARDVVAANQVIATQGELVPHTTGFIWTWISDEDRKRFTGLSFDGFDSPKLDELPWISTYSLGKEDRAIVEEIQAEQNALEETLKERVAAANREALEKARPALEIAARERDEAKAIADAQALAEKKALWAKRLETGTFEMETGEYKERRYSAYWIAKVTFPNGPKAIYEFGQSTGHWGNAGVLSIDCKPGEIIAWGQKDLRRPGDSEHNIWVMREDGGFNVVADKVDAYKLWKANKKEGK